MPRNAPEAELAGAQRALDEARKRLAAGRQRRRDLELEGNSIADALSLELFDAGRAGRDPDIGDHRARIAEIQAQLADLGRVEDGLEAAVTEAANNVQAVRFHFRPSSRRSSTSWPNNSPPSDSVSKPNSPGTPNANATSGWSGGRSPRPSPAPTIRRSRLKPPSCRVASRATRTSASRLTSNSQAGHRGSSKRSARPVASSRPAQRRSQHE